MKKNFSPLSFLASLGAGGIAVFPFAFFQYTYYSSKGLVTFGAMNHSSLGLGKQLFFCSLELIMIIFTFIHFYLTIKNLINFISWTKTN